MSLWKEFNNIDVQDYEALHPDLFAYVKEQMARAEKQFLLIGDSSHDDAALRKFINGPSLAALFRQAAIPHVCIEMPREIATPARMAQYRAQLNETRDGAAEALESAFWAEMGANWRHWAGRYEIAGDSNILRFLDVTAAQISNLVANGKATPGEAQKIIADMNNEYTARKKFFWGPSLCGFSHAGLRVTAADSWQWFPDLVPGVTERVFLGDREVADYIRQQSNGQKTAVIYGAAHFAYDGAMGSRLERTNSLHIDIYADRKSYIETNTATRTHVDFMPDRVYLVKEKSLEDPDPALYHTAEEHLDDDLQKGKDMAAFFYGAAADPADKAEFLDEIVKLPHIDPQYFNYVPPKAAPG